MTTRSGRRPGQSGARKQILDAARSNFARTGFDKTSIRAIAAEAQVDSALVHHYFGTKRELFIAAIALPTDPREVLAPVLAVQDEELGAALLRAVLTVWESEQGDGVIAAFRSMIASGDTSLIGIFMLNIVLVDIAPRVDSPAGSGRLRVSLVASQMSGLLLSRHILGLEPLVSASAEQIVDIVGPTLQRYLTGPLP